MRPKQMPIAKEIEFKPAFRERFEKLTDWEEFSYYCLCYLRRSIRVNTLKISVSELKKRLSGRWRLTPRPWCKEGFWVKNKKSKRIDIGNEIEHALGYYYVQEAASMIPPLVLDVKPEQIILDMCAAPGSKTSQIGQYMENKGVLVANDYVGKRLAPLGINLQRMGMTNCITTLMMGQRFKNMEFDRVLVDAPCSGSGTIRKSLKTITIWNPHMLKKLSNVQKTLIEAGFKVLKKGGIMVYSTCSLEPEENEEVIDSLLKKHNNAEIEGIKLDIKRGDAILEFNGKKFDDSIKKALRIWPQDNDTEGFFVCKIKKV